MDSAAVHTIVDARLRARKAGRRLVLVRGRPDIYRIFTLTGSTADVDIADPDPLQPPIPAPAPALARLAESAQNRLTAEAPVSPGSRPPRRSSGPPTGSGPGEEERPREACARHLMPLRILRDRRFLSGWARLWPTGRAHGPGQRTLRPLFGMLPRT
jgi:hypothetical protein